MPTPAIVYFSAVLFLMVLVALFVKEEEWRDEAALLAYFLGIVIWPLALPIIILIMGLKFIRNKTERFRKRLYNKGVKFE